ncbi:aspartate/glutamate racemase family protein [Achromobacter spanius]|uniref:Aspartate/glutamate racemase family protein n=2 Tax=Achromobacter TaxID=222 RepID=A0A2S5GSP1_9BURK|nr:MULTISPECIES: amino acid racemase [Achromobacter]AYD64734.1 aspartate/glutamate racemase family protein [Achromobacter sp. B7]PPA75905.1 aspartate/glutamate racemase family protein [Achromobacter spanius]
MKTFSQGCYLGVLGGMGPMAGAAFALRLAALTPAAIDQQHIPTLLRNDPRIPDRSSAYMAGGESPLPHMIEGVRFLEQAGAQLIAIPCNTAHLWYHDIAAATGVPVLHIIQAVIDDLRRLGLPGGRIGLMGTAATLKLGLYQKHLLAQGYECIVPDDDEVERYCMGSIRAVKGNRLEDAFAPAAECIARLKARGADAVVLGCTELPLAVPHALRASLGVTLTDSIDALARAAIAHYEADLAKQLIAA